MWNVTIEYDPAVVNWGEPESRFEALLEGLGESVTVEEYSSGTDFITGQRDVWYTLLADDEAIERLRADAPDWTFEREE